MRICVCVCVCVCVLLVLHVVAPGPPAGPTVAAGQAVGVARQTAGQQDRQQGEASGQGKGTTRTGAWFGPGSRARQEAPVQQGSKASQHSRPAWASHRNTIPGHTNQHGLQRVLLCQRRLTKSDPKYCIWKGLTLPQFLSTWGMLHLV